MSKMQIIHFCLLLFTACLSEAGCNSLPNSQQEGGDEIAEELKTLQSEFQETKMKLKATNKALSELIITLLNSKDNSGDADSDGDGLVRRRRDLSDENDDLLSHLPISSLLGLRGKDGRNGEMGRDGRDGKDGANGVPGNEGKDGKDGINGLPAKDGKDGETGRDGRDGKDGENGEPGKDGKDGVDGASGESGDCGENGASGQQGRTGAPGRDGQAGEKGVSGAPGIDGVIGRLGEKGNSGLPGEKGDSGLPGGKGDAGGDGTPGQAGSPGLQGRDGRDGTAGQPGEKGAPGDSLESIGTVYIRWGRTVCGNQSTLIYSGFTGGSRHDQTGGGVNYQCMPPTPEYNSYRSGGDNSYMAGTEYESHTYGLFSNEAHSKNVPCARCYTNTRPAMMMLPAKRTCPSGWTREYEGYLMSGYYSHHQSTFECVDAHPEYIASSTSNTNGALFYFVKPICSGAGTTHHCPPYINDRQLTCVVCSK